MIIIYMVIIAIPLAICGWIIYFAVYKALMRYDRERIRDDPSGSRDRRDYF